MLIDKCITKPGTIAHFVCWTSAALRLQPVLAALCAVRDQIMFKIPVLIIVLVLLMSCGEKSDTIVLEIKNNGEFINSEKVENIDQYFRSLEGSKDFSLVILSDQDVPLERMSFVSELAAQKTFKDITLTMVK